MKSNFWNIVLSLIFTALVVCGYLWLASTDRLSPWVPLTDFMLMAFATMRLIRLFTYDTVTAFIRSWLADAEEGSFLGTLGTLLRCPWCNGIWFASAVVFFYFATPIAWYAIFILALSAVASLLQIFANFVGWSTEAKKKESGH